MTQFLSKRSVSASRNGFPGDHSRLDPPDPISNSEVKRLSADDSVRFPHVKVGHCQDFITIFAPLVYSLGDAKLHLGAFRQIYFQYVHEKSPNSEILEVE